MLKGFAITPVVLGRIGIGEKVERGGKRLPSKLNHIVLTGTHQVNGNWKLHPEMERLVEAQKSANIPEPEKLRSIPVRILFDTPENNFRAEYTCFDDKARPVCAGNGWTAKRRVNGSMVSVDCLGSDHCEFGRENRCKQFGRLIVGLEGLYKNDPLSGFMFRTTSFNSIRALTVRLQEYAGAMNGKMAGLPCNLKMHAVSTSASYRKPVFYLDLEPRSEFLSNAKEAFSFRKEWEEAGLNREKLEAAVTEGYKQSDFFESGDDGVDVVDEFYMLNEEDESFDDKPLVGVCVEAQVTEIVRLFSVKAGNHKDLMRWLGKPVETAVADLTPEEADRSIATMQIKEAKMHGENKPKDGNKKVLASPPPLPCAEAREPEMME